MTDLEWSPVVVKLGDLSHWADNPVTLSKAQAKKLLKSTERLGRMQTLAIGPQNGDGKHPLYDGHQRVNVWGAAFGMELQVNALQSSRPLTDEERHQVPIMLRTATGSLDWDALAGWDANSLMEWGFDSDMLDGWKRDIAALGNLIESEAPEPQDAEPQIDRAEELQEKWQVKAGDLWRIGEHRLLCGDSTKREDVERVMQGEKAANIVTDPPFNVGFDYKTGFNDSRELEEYGNWLWNVIESWEKLLKQPWRVFIWQAISTCGYWHSWFKRDYRIFASIKAFVQFRPTAVQYSWDPILFWSCGISEVKPIAGRRDYFVSNSTPGNWGESSGHPCPRQVDVCIYILRELCEQGKILEPFCGSGTILVACEQTGHIGRGIEIEPKYCAVTLERMSTAFPALTIERI